MIAKYLVPAAAVLGSVAAQSSCTQSTATINAPADATGIASCKTFTGDVLIAPGVVGTVDLSGSLSQIKGSLIAEDDGLLTGISSSSLTTVTEEFRLMNLTGLSSLAFPKLNTVGSISWQALTVLDSLTFGTPGVTNAKKVVISDTFLRTLAGIDITSADVVDINNNGRLSRWDSTLGNLTDTLNLMSNGMNFTVTFDDLIWIANATVNNVSDIAMPALKTVNGSLSFGSNFFSSFSAPNLTNTQSGNINFVGNNNLKNISFPQLTTIGGALLIANNTALGSIDGFPKLEQVKGAVKLRGSFENVTFPALDDVRGAFDISSTENISTVCDTFQKLAPTKQGGNNKIQGVYHCDGNNALANNDTGGNTSSSGTTGGSGGSGGQDGKGNSAAGVAINAALLGLGVVGGLVALL